MFNFAVAVMVRSISNFKRAKGSAQPNRKSNGLVVFTNLEHFQVNPWPIHQRLLITVFKYVFNFALAVVVRSLAN